MDTRNPIIGRMTHNAARDSRDNSGFAYDEGRRAFEQASGRSPVTSPDPTREPVASTAGADELEALYRAPERAREGERMTIDDVVTRTGISFAVLLVGAVVGWNSPGLVLFALVGGLVLGLVNAFKRKVSPPLILTYAAVQGVFLGGISVLFTAIAGGEPIVQQAVIGTLVAFGVMLWLYSTKRIRVTGKFVKFMMAAMISYLLIAVASVIGAIFFQVGGGWGFYGVGPLGILLCVAGVGLASFSLLMDFESTKQAIAYGVPKQEAWRATFGFLVTLVWLYLEILRLLAILNSND
jgi:uncharacterized YccA/Bax inhibitor family protein